MLSTILAGLSIVYLICVIMLAGYVIKQQLKERNRYFD